MAFKAFNIAVQIVQISMILVILNQVESVSDFLVASVSRFVKKLKKNFFEID